MLRSELDNVAQSDDDVFFLQNSLKKMLGKTFFTRRKSLFILATRAAATAFVTLKNDLKHSMQYGIMENCSGYFAVGIILQCIHAIKLYTLYKTKRAQINAPFIDKRMR